MSEKKKYKNLEETLFARWQEKRPGMAKDGVVDDVEYYNCAVKVLFILKEVNGWKNGDLRELLKRGEKWRTWNNISRWQLGVQHLYKTGKIEFRNKINQRDRQSILKDIAVINLKKESGGAVSNMREIRTHALEDKKFLKEQIDLYSPDLVICCGTGSIVAELELFESIKTINPFEKFGYAKNNTQLIIDYFHPQCRKSKEALFHDLMRCIEKVK